MRSNIIQMLLNASSNKGGGSDPVKPESDWTIVHFLAGDVDVTGGTQISHFTFKTKTGKYYHLQQCNAVIDYRGSSSMAYDYSSRIIYGFVDLLNSGSQETGVESISDVNLNRWDSSEIFKKDPSGRPMLFAITPEGYHGSDHEREQLFAMTSNGLYLSEHTLEHLFATNGEFNTPYIGAPNPTTILPDGSSLSSTYGLTSIGINVPKSQLERVTICTTNVNNKWYLIQDQTSTPAELLKTFSDTHYPKLDFSSDKIIFKHETADNFSCWGATEKDYDLTLK